MGKIKKFYWTEELEERAVGLWREGKTATEIANAISTISGCIVTRNAALGKIHRMGKFNRSAVLSQRQIDAAKSSGNTGHTRPKSRVTGRRSPSKIPAVPIKPDPNHTDIHAGNIEDILLLEADHCRWRIDYPDKINAAWCGHEKLAGSSYCAEHLRRSRRDLQESPVKKFVPMARDRTKTRETV